MGKEIERKFLVNKELWEKICPQKGSLITQGYIMNQPDRSVRIRLRGEQGFITIKGGRDKLTRIEFEYKIPKEEAEELLKLFCSKQIKKQRFKVDYKGFTWEIDEFFSPTPGLLLAEIELPTETTPFELPNWVTEEVTGKSEYYNANMLS